MPPPTATATVAAPAPAANAHGLAYPPAADVLSKKPSDPKLEEVYELHDVLGKGAFGVVRLAHPKSAASLPPLAAAAPAAHASAAADNDNAPGSPVAVKSISKAKLVCAEDVRDVRTEVAVMSHVGDHRNVVALRSTHEDGAAVHLVMDLCKGGELFDAIVQAGSFSERKAAAVFRVMVETLHHCHELGVMHRDLKPENFLLTGPKGGAAAAAAAGAATRASSGGADGGPPIAVGGRVMSVVDDPEEVARQLKLTDWGLSVFCRPGQRFRDLVGSPFYVAPEVLRKDYGVEADMWSLGVILYILLSGLPPFWGDTEDQIFRMVLRGDPDLTADPWPSISDEAKDLVRRLLTVDPAKRATAGQTLAHPWLQARHPRRGASNDDKPFDSAVLQRLRNFAAMSRLKRVALLVVGQSLSPEELRGLRELFRSIDADNSGSITPSELREALAAWEHRIPEAELAALMAVADVDASGTIDYNEFVAATAHVSRLEREEVLRRAFDTLDLDASGAISAAELSSALEKFGLADEDARALIASADANGDGKLDFDEFAALMREKSSMAALELGAGVGGAGSAVAAAAAAAGGEGGEGEGPSAAAAATSADAGGGARAHPIDVGADPLLELPTTAGHRRSKSTRAQMAAIL